jgi:sugar phosphate permease
LLQGVRMVLSEKNFWALAVWFFCTGGILFGFGGLWAGPYLMQVYTLTKTQTGNILMMIAVGMIVGSPILSYLSEKVFRARKPVLLISSFTLTGIWVLFVFFVDGLSVLLLYGLFFLLGIFASGIVVIGFTVAKELFPTKIAGTSTGMANLFPFAGGALLQPLIGLVLDCSGRSGTVYSVEAYRLSFVGFLVAAVLALISVFLIRETHA